MLKELERQNAQLKRLLAQRDVQVDAAKQLLRKNGQALPLGLRNGLRERDF
jgi:hypothetical protein